MVKKKKLFLRWCLINLLTFSLMGAITFLYFEKIKILFSGGAKLGLIAVAIFVLATIYCGFLSWKADSIIESLDKFYKGSVAEFDIEPLFLISSKADYVQFWGFISPYIGLLGSILGTYLVMTGGQGLSVSQIDIAHLGAAMVSMKDGVGTALVSTGLGVVVMVILYIEHHLLSSSINYDLEKFARKNL